MSPMAASITLIFALFLSIISSSSSSLFSPANVTINNVNGFRTYLIHRDSPQSPLYNPNSTLADRIKAAKMRSLARQRQRQQRYSNSPDDLTAPVMFEGGEYLIRFSIGTPPMETYAIVDTGSELTWLQCLPCEKCYPQTTPYFDSTKSSSYESIKCNTSECVAVKGNCYGQENKCRYQKVYGDKSYSRGYLSHETLIFEDTKSGGSFPLHGMIFGCGVDNKDTSRDNTAGIVGLNRGQLSLITQSSFDRFAYCFVPVDNKDVTSPITFGLLDIFEGGRTPIKYTKANNEYYLNLVGISVGNESIPIPPGAFDVTDNGKGGFFIDSGTQYTIIHSIVYQKLVAKVKEKTLYDSIVRDTTRVFDLCYDVKMSDIEFGTPAITFHFFGGTDLVLKGINAWADNGYGLVCLAMRGSYKYSILGNHQQQNVYVAYDLKEKYLTFKPMDCTKL